MSAQRETPAGRKKILLVDDDRHVLDALSRVMVSMGYAVTAVSNADQALHHIRQTYGLDLVLMDCWMPLTNGIEALQRIKIEYPLLPVIIMSGTGTDATESKALRLGADGYITKQISVVTLKQKIEMTLASANERMESGPRPGDDKLVTRILLADDCGPFCAATRLQLVNHGYQVDIARDGEEAVAKAAGDEYDIVLMDINMPKKNGIQAAREIKEQAPLTFIVAITGEADVNEISQALEAGSFLCLRKPIRMQQFRKTLRYFEKMNRMNRHRAAERERYQRLGFAKQFLYNLKRKFGCFAHTYPWGRLTFGVKVAALGIVFTGLIYLLTSGALSLFGAINRADDPRHPVAEKSYKEMFEIISGYLERDEQRELR